MKTIRQEVTFKAPPHDVYQSLMDPGKHSEFTGAQAEIDAKAGGKFTAYDGSIYGKFLELVPDERIVQEWYCETEGWPEGHFSKVTITLKAVKGGTKMNFVQTGVPDAAYEDISSGWEEYYWKPMRMMLEG